MKKPAFTLAEVLVTLGIIGVVAAMTLPMLAKNYQFFIRQQQFKKAYAALSAAVQKTQIDLGEGVRCHYGGGRDYEDNDSVHSKDCEYFYMELAKNLQLIKTCKGNALSEMCISKNMRGGEIVYKEVQGGNDPDAALDKYNRECKGFSASYMQNRSYVYVTNSGFLYTFYFSGRNQYPLLLMDINGLQGPNKWGYDVFVFSLSKAKQYDSVFSLKPSTICHALDVGGYYTTDFFNYLYGQNAEL